MMLQIFAFKDNALGCYTQPFYSDVPMDNVVTGVTRSIVGAQNRSNYKYKVLYKIGDFDDSTGKITPCDPVLVLDCDVVLAGLENGRGDKEVGA